MKSEKGIAYCGLACCICSENENCAGCRNKDCKNKDWCKNFNCCKKKGINGCWECEDFPCQGSMLDKIRIRAFARYMAEYGESDLLRKLERNEKAGIVYHYKDQLIGDYDIPHSEEEIIHMIRYGKQT